MKNILMDLMELHRCVFLQDSNTVQKPEPPKPVTMPNVQYILDQYTNL